MDLKQRYMYFFKLQLHSPFCFPFRLVSRKLVFGREYRPAARTTGTGAERPRLHSITPICQVECRGPFVHPHPVDLPVELRIIIIIIRLRITENESPPPARFFGKDPSVNRRGMLFSLSPCTVCSPLAHWIHCIQVIRIAMMPPSQRSLSASVKNSRTSESVKAWKRRTNDTSVCVRALFSAGACVNFLPCPKKESF